jgi:UDP-N-acetylmuramate: L-alanyl-gamma-D-glutamyl-meso-diaminopimelate ligase
VCSDYPDAVEVARMSRATVETYGTRDALWQADEIVHLDGAAHFDLVRGGKKLRRMVLTVGGPHNVQNALGAIAAASALGLSLDEIARGLESFHGVKRRQEIRGEPRGVLVIDDFAHHPTAVRETLLAIRARFPGRPLWALFEPRSNTARSNLHQREYATAFAGAARAVVSTPPPTDRVKESERLDVGQLVQEIEKAGTPARAASGPEEILELVRREAKSGDVLLVMSNGAFGGLVGKLVETLGG